MYKTAITTDSAALIANPDIDVILEVTGSPAAGIRHALLCCEHKKHIVMINVEADVLMGPLLARRAKEAGIIYSMAYGDLGTSPTTWRLAALENPIQCPGIKDIFEGFVGGFVGEAVGVLYPPMVLDQNAFLHLRSV
ncbi:hypothetical protein LTS10_013193 [Elasticomyces elasticus]|nr:hypothetical protein LTS10_013193 [Elasticomyces elasticus]